MSQVVDGFYGIMREYQAGGDTIQPIKRVLSKDKPAYIVPIGDVHLGHKKANLNLLSNILKYVEETENCYTVLLGDLGETATKVSVGAGMFDENIHIPEQKKMLRELFRPLAAKQKIIGAVMGNHEFRLQQSIGMNPIEDLADFLQFPYCEYQGFAELEVGKQKYSMVWHHGVGGGATEGSKVNSSMKQGAVVEADLSITGHTHARNSVSVPIMCFDNGEVKQRLRHFVTVGSFLEYTQNYPQMKLLPISEIGPVLIELMPTSKEIHIYK